MPAINRLDSRTIDAALHLLDRQVLDVDGAMVCNVDDLELTDRGRGHLAVTGLLTGGAALVPRFSGRAGDWLRATWSRLGIEQAERNRPRWIGLDLIATLGSAVDLSAGRERLLRPQRDPDDGVVLRRMSDLLGLPVRTEAGADLGYVLDVRLAPGARQYDVRQLVVGRGRFGTLLGYDRGDLNGPWLVARAVRLLHRHTGQLSIDQVSHIDWDNEVVLTTASLAPLEVS